MDSPEYLYHYTNIDTLALILKNRTIRFNSLDKMDDLQEKETADLKKIGQFCYISSWTDDISESIPMWKMYASLDEGVRIKLRKNPFKQYLNYIDEISKSFGTQTPSDSSNASITSYIPLPEMFSNHFFTHQAMTGDFLHKVEYTSDKNKLYPKMVNKDEKGQSIAIGELGKYKNPYWSFQKEWRYIFIAIPLDLTCFPQKSYLDFCLLNQMMSHDIAKQPFPYYDMTIDNQAFAEMSITLCPQISDENRKKVQQLINCYNQTAELMESSLLGLI